MLRFQVSAEDSAKFATWGAAAANALFELEAQGDHYVDVWEEIVSRLPPDKIAESTLPPMQLARGSAQREQWWALRRDLAELVADAHEAGNEALQKMGPQIRPKPDQTLSVPDPEDPQLIALAAFVMFDGRCRKVVTAREKMQRIVERLEAAEDSAIRALGAGVRSFINETASVAEYVESRRKAGGAK